MKRVFKLGILLGFIFSLCTAAQAATTACKINGVVTDSISGEAIPFVTIGIENNEGKVLSRIASDALGKFMITASTVKITVWSSHRLATEQNTSIYHFRKMKKIKI